MKSVHQCLTSHTISGLSACVLYLAVIETYLKYMMAMKSVWGLQFNPEEENLMATGSADRTVVLYDMRYFSQRLHVLQAHTEEVFQVRHSVDRCVSCLYISCGFPFDHMHTTGLPHARAKPTFDMCDM